MRIILATPTNACTRPGSIGVDVGDGAESDGEEAADDRGDAVEVVNSACVVEAKFVADEALFRTVTVISRKTAIVRCHGVTHVQLLESES